MAIQDISRNVKKAAGCSQSLPVLVTAAGNCAPKVHKEFDHYLLKFDSHSQVLRIFQFAHL
jgi:hypothetical protein